MKILHVIEIRGIGGAEKMLGEFLQNQAQFNKEIFCLIIYKKQFQNTASEFGEKLLTYKVSVFYQKYSKFKNVLILTFKINSFLYQIKPQVIHTHLRLADMCLALLKFLKLKTPVITTMHGYGDEVQNQIAGGRSVKINKTIRFYLVQFILKNLNAYVFISDFLMRFCIDNKLIINDKKAYRIDNAVTIDYNVTLDKRVDRNNIRIILPGRLIELKGHIYAFEAMQILSKKYPSIILDCYGEGPYQDILMEQINTMSINHLVNLKGFNQNIIKKISEYDIVLIPSLFESFGVVFLDAFVSQVPVIAFDLPAGNEIITDGVNGLLAIPKSSVDIANKIELIVDDDILRENIVKAATEKLFLKYDMNLMVEKYLSLYKTVINEK